MWSVLEMPPNDGTVNIPELTTNLERRVDMILAAAKALSMLAIRSVN